MLKSGGYNIDFVGSNSYGYGSVPEFDPDDAGFGGYTAKQILHLMKTRYKPSAVIFYMNAEGKEMTSKITLTSELFNYIKKIIFIDGQIMLYFTREM